jgi:hypothetical protein
MNGLASISPTRFDFQLFAPNALDLASFAIQELTAVSGYSSSQGAEQSGSYLIKYSRYTLVICNVRKDCPICLVRQIDQPVIASTSCF